MLFKNWLIVLYLIMLAVLTVCIVSYKSWVVIGNTVQLSHNTIIDSIRFKALPKATDSEKTIIFYFDIECSYCTEIMTTYNQNIKYAKKSNFIFMSNKDSLTSLAKLQNYFGTNRHTYVFDHMKDIFYKLNIRSYPTLIEYKKDKNQYSIYKEFDEISLFLKSIN
jgi:hypothetical protein